MTSALRGIAPCPAGLPVKTVPFVVATSLADAETFLDPDVMTFEVEARAADGRGGFAVELSPAAVLS